MFQALRNALHAARDYRVLRSKEREGQRLMTTVGSQASDKPKSGGKLNPVRPFREITNVRERQRGKFTKVTRRLLTPSDTTPNRHTHARLRNPKRNPRIKFLNKHKGCFYWHKDFA